jgi:hypothetical protein
MTHISLSEWLGVSGDPFIQRYGLPDVIKKAVASAASDVAREIDRRRKEQEDKLMGAQQSYNNNLNFGTPNASLGKVYG